MRPRRGMLHDWPCQVVWGGGEWPVGTEGSDRLHIVQEYVSLYGENLGRGTVRRGLACSGY